MLSQYTKEKLAEKEQLRIQVCENHAHYYLGLLKQITKGTLEERNSAPKRLEPDISNLSQAWQVASEGAWVEYILGCAYGLERLFEMLALYKQGETLLNFSIKQLDVNLKNHQAALGNAMASRAWLLKQLSYYKEAIELAGQALHISQLACCERGVLTALNTLGSANDQIYLFKKAKHYYQKALSITVPQSDNYSNVLSNIVAVDRKLGNYSEAKKLLRESIKLFKKSNNYAKVATMKCKLGVVLLETGDYSEADLVLEKGFLLAEENNLHFLLLRFKLHMAKLAVACGDLDKAGTLCQEALKQAHCQGRKSLAAELLVVLGQTVLLEGNIVQAQNYLLQSVKLAVDLEQKPVQHQILIFGLELYLSQQNVEKAIILLDYFNAQGSNIEHAVYKRLAAIELNYKESVNVFSKAREKKLGKVPSFEQLTKNLLSEA